MTETFPIEIDVSTLESWMKQASPPHVVDVREDWERALCAIEGSFHLPLGTLPAEFESLPRDRAVVFVCHHGGRSMRATQWLRAQGWSNTVNVAGGIDAWATDIDPQMARY